MKVGAAIKQIECFKRGVGMMGYGLHSHIVEGQKTPLKVRTFFIQNDPNTKRLIWVTPEILSASQAIKRGVLNLLHQSNPRLNIKDCELMISATHTHSGPGGYFDYAIYNMTISGFNLEADDIETNFSYSEFGANIYLNQKGNGFFVSLGRGQFNTELTFNDLDFDGARGSATTDFDFGTTSIKLDLKSGGSFYFRFEVGYGIGNIPDTIDFEAISSTGKRKEFEEDIPPIPGLSSGATIIGNIGFGVAF